jgi:hypothetical protein
MILRLLFVLLKLVELTITVIISFHNNFLMQQIKKKKDLLVAS